MNDLFDDYQQQVRASYSSIPWLKETQKEAFDALKNLKFPSRHHEDWKYTSVDALLKERFECSAKPVALQESRQDAPVGLKITIQQGHVFGIEALESHLPKGALILSLSDALALHSDKIKPYLNSILKTQHGFHALNTAMIQQGVFIYLPKDVVIEEPILLSHWQSIANKAAYLRHLVIMEAGSSMTLIEDYDGDHTSSYLTNTVTEVHLKEHAKLTHYKMQRESTISYHLGHIAVKQNQHSQFNSHSLSLGGKLVRSDITIDLCEPKAHCSMNGVYAPGNAQHIDHHTVVNHLAADCESTQDYKGILMGHSKAVFNGKVMVAPLAQHTVAKQQNKNLLLSSQAEVDTKPELNIFANDVICTHGATVGQLDEEALFYLATRGIDRAKASEYLIRAFTIENFRALQNDKLSDWAGALLNQQLRGAHGSQL